MLSAAALHISRSQTALHITEAADRNNQLLTDPSGLWLLYHPSDFASKWKEGTEKKNKHTLPGQRNLKLRILSLHLDTAWYAKYSMLKLNASRGWF